VRDRQRPPVHAGTQTRLGEFLFQRCFIGRDDGHYTILHYIRAGIYVAKEPV
jgi:hypothetical protein